MTRDREPGAARVVSTRTFFRAAPRLAFEGARDVLRAIEIHDGWLVAMANAYDHGFATCYPAGSRLLLDAFERAADERADRPSPERARESFEAAARAFVAAEPPAPRDEDFPDEVPSASLTVALVRCDEVRCFVLGGEPVVMTDNGSVIRRSATHDLATLYPAHHLEPAPPSAPDVLVETIGRGRVRPEETVWWASVGAAVWVLSGSLRGVTGDVLAHPEWPREEDLEAQLFPRGRAPFVAGVRLDIVG